MTRDLAKWATWSEILAQPEIWAGWAGTLDLAAAHDFVAAAGVDEVWFSGAGTSAYVGDILTATLDCPSGLRFRSVPTTDLVARPDMIRGRRPLVVNFGRSGNSAETIGTLDILDAVAPDAPRVNVTCNGDSALATRKGAGPQHVVVLPAATHDAGFAMTSSFSTMLLTALAVFGQDGTRPITRAAAILHDLLPRLTAFAADRTPPERIVFLGSGPLTYAARESALKVMELAAGQIPALWDSTLGFRHGPKSFVRGATDVVLFLSPDAHARRYDDDLAAELRAQFPAARVTTLGPGGDVDLPMPDGAGWAAANAVALAQVLAVHWSDALGLNVDNPFEGQGTLTRVVSGVRLYPVAA
ncbi:MAG: hypothetical protein RLZZ528_2124 [Pseudomonadota bacterium]|jgi:tagatose-6-phosphate ketose/aldose isomerase